jgi:dynein assembly factor 1
LNIEMATSELDRELHTQVLKREAIKEKAYREERDRQDAEFHAQLGMGGSEMSKQELRKLVDADRRIYYRTEELNDKLYIHYKGWRDLKNLDGWTGLKTLYAECNAFSRIAGLQNCTKLRSLFLQENCINKISGIETLTELWSLNLSSNFIERIEGLENLKGLNTLIISKNKLGHGGVSDLDALVDTNIGTLDVQDNRIDDPDVVPEVFTRMPGLRVLYLKGNPAAKKIINYRKSLTVYCKDLRYLDDRPVFEDDRRTAEAFNRGGIEEQRAEQKRIREEKNEKHDRNMRAFSEMVENSRREKRERDAMRLEDKFTDETDPVESFERRAKRLTEEWKEENKEDLKDDAKEYAERALQAEKTAAQVEKRAEDEQKATPASREPAQESGDTGAAEAGDTAGKDVDIWDAPAQPEKPVDNRKLVYDDIWDDMPPRLSAAAAAPSAAPSASTAPSPAGPPASLGPAAGEGVFLPWAEGAVGMDALAPSPEVLEKRKAALHTKAAEAANTKACAEAQGLDESKPAWHSKYLEQVAKTQAKVQAPVPKSAFVPPPRVAESPAEPKAAAASSPMGAGELDEMD